MSSISIYFQEEHLLSINCKFFTVKNVIRLFNQITISIHAAYQTKEVFMSHQKIIAITILSLLFIPTLSLAKDDVTIKITAEKEVTDKTTKATKRVPAKETKPGDIITYTITCRNSGKDTATNVIVDDPIPAGTIYLPGSAFGNDADITFSIDKGKSYKQPAYLTYDMKNSAGKVEKRIATPEEYTHIRWDVKRIPAGGSGQVGFKVKVK